MNVKIRGVQRVKGRNGAYVYYHRPTKTRLREKPGTLAFAAEVEQAASKARNAVIAGRAGSWGGLVTAYLAAPEFGRLAPRTKDDYQKVLAYLEPMAAAPIEQIDAAEIVALRDATLAERKWRFTKHMLQVMSAVMEWGKLRKLSAGYPLKGSRQVVPTRPKNMPKANRPWDDVECDYVLKYAGGGLKRAVALGMFCAMRIEDVATVRWSAYTDRALDNGRVVKCVEWDQGKTGDAVWMPAAPELQELLDAAPRTALTIVTGATGRPITKAGVSKAFRQLIIRLERDGLVMLGLTFHGLRHTAGKGLADLGADPRMIQSLLGHRSMAASLHYSADASRRRGATAAVELLAKHRAARKETKQ